MAQIITSTGIASVLENEHLFVDVSKTHTELAGILERERHNVGWGYKTLLHNNPELVNESIYVGPGNEKLTTKRLSPYICWLIHRLFVLVQMTNSRKLAVEYYNTKRDLFSKSQYEQAKNEVLNKEVE